MKKKNLFRIVLPVVAAFAFLSCSGDDDNTHRRLTEKQKETVGNAIKGEYGGKYVIAYTDAESEIVTGEDGKMSKTMKSEEVKDVVMSVSGYGSRSVAMHKFPIRMLSEIVTADADLGKALGSLSDIDIVSAYKLDYAGNYEDISFFITPSVISLTLNYRGTDHHIRIEMSDGSNEYRFTPKDLENHHAFKSAGYITTQFTAIYDGTELIQKFDLWEGNGMFVTFHFDR